MVNQITEFSEEILKIPKGFEKEIEILYKLGIKHYEIQYLIYLKIKENIIIRMN